MPELPYRVAVIGCGRRARVHVAGLDADKRLQIVALADAKAESAEAFKTDCGYESATTYTDYKDLLQAERPEVAVVTLWTSLHLPVIRDCIEAGVKVILSEKPMAGTWSECVEIARLAETSGVVLTFAHQRRFAPGNIAVREAINAGTFGTIERMELFSPPHLLDCGTHSMDQAMSFNSEAGVTWVHGAVDLTNTIRYFNVPAEGNFTGTFRFDNGVHGTIRCGNHELEMVSGVRVTGTDGFVEVLWDGDIKRAVKYSDPAWTFSVLAPIEHAQMIGLVKNAIDAYETGAEPELSYKKALRANEVLFAFYESARTHKRVTLPLEGVTGNPLFEMLEETANERPLKELH